MILGTFPAGSPEWHEARRYRVGGSEIATVCGWNPWETREQLLARKLGELEPRKQTDAMDRGNRLEDAVLGWLRDKYDLAIDPDASTATHVSETHPFALYNPDAVTRDGILLEAKTASDRSEEKGWGRAGTDRVPIHYACQCQWGMGILGLDRAYIGVLHGATNGRPDLKFASYALRFEPAQFRFLLTKAEAFINELTTTKGIAA